MRVCLKAFQINAAGSSAPASDQGSVALRILRTPAADRSLRLLTNIGHSTDAGPAPQGASEQYATSRALIDGGVALPRKLTSQMLALVEHVHHIFLPFAMSDVDHLQGGFSQIPPAALGSELPPPPAYLLDNATHVLSGGGRIPSADLELFFESLGHGYLSSAARAKLVSSLLQYSSVPFTSLLTLLLHHMATPFDAGIWGENSAALAGANATVPLGGMTEVPCLARLAPLHAAFLAFDRFANGTIAVEDIRLVLAALDLHFSEDEFDALSASLARILAAPSDGAPMQRVPFHELAMCLVLSSHSLPSRGGKSAAHGLEESHRQLVAAHGNEAQSDGWTADGGHGEPEAEPRSERATRPVLSADCPTPLEDDGHIVTPLAVARPFLDNELRAAFDLFADPATCTVAREDDVELVLEHLGIHCSDDVLGAALRATVLPGQGVGLDDVRIILMHLSRLENR